MNVLIPLGGKGERFKSDDYNTPKVLTPVLGKCIISWVIDSFNIQNTDCITIVYNNVLDQYNFQDILKKQFSDKTFNFIKLPFQTSGPVETILYGLSRLPESVLNDKLIIHDGDSFIKNNQFENLTNENEIFYTLDYNEKPLFSYIELNENQVIRIEEKIKISNNANIGCYTFKNAKIFQKYATKCDQSINEIYISHVYKKMLEDSQKITAIEIKKENYTCLGTPLQVIEFCNKNTSKPLRFCFDLDNTLVTFPCIKNDYSTVEPIQKNIDFLKHLKKNGHYIIIYTARRMETHKGNVSKIVKDIGKITLETLDKFGIEYDEICFGKPHANFYIDDLAVNSFSNIEKATGFYINSVAPRSFNSVKINKNSITKTSNKSLNGEIFYYQNIPKELSHLFPKLIKTDGESFIEIEKINGTLFSSMYSHKELKKEHIDLLFDTLNELHCHNIQNQNSLNIYANYNEKLTSRFENYNYSKFKDSSSIYKTLKHNLNSYEKNLQGEKSIIHGDFVFSNIFLEKNQLKLIDMRGKLQNQCTIYGDKFYDYAKAYQSLIGYDFILNSKPIAVSYCAPLIQHFEEKFTQKYGIDKLNQLKYLTASLLFTLIPLHNDNKCDDYYNLIYYLI
jgi:capsule biosynthesis phosphatase